MDSRAWPFLIGRSRNHGHRIIVIPEFMTDPRAAVALRDATGSSARQSEVMVRELQGLTAGPVSVVYRSLLPRGSQYGLDGEDILTDENGRPIRLVEGFTVRQPESGARKLGITQADLDRARAEVIGAYQEFWSQEGFARHESTAFPVGAASGRRGPVISLHSSEPWIIRSGQAASVPDLARALPTPTPPQQSALSVEPAVKLWLVLFRRALVILAILAAGILVAVIAVFSQKWFTSVPNPRSSAARVLSSVCKALDSGSVGTAYDQTTAGYQQTTSQAAFRADLLPGGAPKATACNYAITASDNSSVTATLTVATATALVTSWRVTVTRQPDQAWLISKLALPAHA